MSVAKVIFIASLAIASGAGSESAVTSGASSATQTQSAMRAAALSKTNMWAKYMVPMNFIASIAESEMEKAHEKYHLALQKVDFMEIDQKSEEFQEAERMHKIANLLEKSMKEMLDGAKEQVSQQLQQAGLNSSLMEDALQAQHEKYSKKHPEVSPESLIQFVEGNETSDAPAPTSFAEIPGVKAKGPLADPVQMVRMEPEKEQTAPAHDAIQKIYYINDANKVRNEFMQKQMTKATLEIVSKEIPFERFKATRFSEVQGKHETTFSNGKVATYLASYSDAPKYTTVATYLSHAKLLQKINEEIYDDRPVLILEDDAQLKDNWMHDAKEALKVVPKDWEILKIGYWGAKKGEDKVSDTGGKIYKACCYSDTGDYYQGNQAYLVRPSSVPKIMKALKQRPVADFDKVILMAPENMEQDIHTYAIETSVADHAEVGKPSKTLNAREARMAKVLDNIEKMAASA